MGSVRVSRRSVLWIVAGFSAVALVAALVWWSPWNGSASSEPQSTGRTPFASPTPEVESVRQVPATATADAALVSWRPADSTALSGVAAQVGDAAHGEIAVQVDAAAVEQPTRALLGQLKDAGGDAVFAASVRLLSMTREVVSAEFRIGDTVVPLPELHAEWVTIEADVPDASSATTVELWITGPVSGLSVDAVSLMAGDEERVRNGSFEDVDVEWGIRNTSLVLGTDTATLALAVPEGATDWRVRDADGAELAEGTVESSAALTAAPLRGVGQGYVEITVEDATGRSVSTPAVLVDLDTLTVPLDTRIGTHLHAQKPFASDATPTAASVGVGAIRVGDNWQVTEPSAGRFRFSEPFTNAFAEARALGMDTLMVVGRTNTAYDGGRTPSSASGLAAYARYAAAIAEHFRPTAFEVYNEFNHKPFNNSLCGRSPDCYLPVLRAAESGIRQVDDDVTIIGGGTALSVPEWFDGLWGIGGLDHVDAVSFHPYDGNGNPNRLIDILAKSRSTMAAHGDPKPVWITEFGWTSASGNVSFEQQAERLVRAETIYLGSGVDHAFWYDLVNDADDRDAHEGNFGLFEQRRAGVAAFPPKPVALAQALVARSVAGKEGSRLDDLPSNQIGFSFGEGSERVVIAWGVDSRTTLTVPAEAPVLVTLPGGETSWVLPENGEAEIRLQATPSILSFGRSDGSKPDGAH